MNEEWPCVVVDADGTARLIGSALLRPGRYRLVADDAPSANDAAGHAP